MNQLLATSDHIVQEIDSVEYGLTDIQEYYANTGGLKKAAEKQSGKKVTTSFVENFSKDTTPLDLIQPQLHQLILLPTINNSGLLCKHFSHHTKSFDVFPSELTH